MHFFLPSGKVCVLGEFNNFVMTVELLVRIEDLDTGFVTFKVPAFNHFSALLFIF